MSTYIYFVLYVSGFSGLLGSSIKMVSSYTLGQILPHTFPEKKKTEGQTDAYCRKFSISNILGEQREKQTQRLYIHSTNKRLLSSLSIVCMYMFARL